MVLQRTKLKVESDEYCQSIYGPYIDYNVDSMFCAYANNTDTCQGDSGGPFFLESASLPNHFAISVNTFQQFVF